MIQHSEIKNLETEWSLREDVIEKDYVIGWLLWGIGSHAVLRDAWIFKGGTCLKKCYFETYRFSEDLDFTVLPAGPFTPDDVLPMLDDVVARVHDASGLDFTIQPRRMKLRPGGSSSEGRVYYRGPRQAPSAGLIKLDLNAEEKLARPPVLRTIAHAFTDALPGDGTVRCYSFEELFAEKIRALGERTRPRDLYDVVNMHRHSDLRKEPGLIREVLHRKCESKGVDVPSYDGIMSSPVYPELESEWENMLAHQLPNLPPHSLYVDAMKDFFDWLEERVAAEVLPTIPAATGEDVSWTQPVTVYAWGQGIPLEPVRFAGANYLCVEIDYRKEGGERTRRTIEPYSLRRTLDGNIILHAFDRDRRAHRAFRVDRLLAINVTQIPFKPRYQVEFTQTGNVRIEPTTTGSRSTSFVTRLSTRPRRNSRPRIPSYGPTYIVECTYCRKRFRRKTRSVTIKKHKDKSGWDCSGRTGYLVDTVY
ncbi:MAG: WYL domain-containing protein [Lentisphaerales bacterium]|nr:MAG: WYL domain-containing protein [Lentisphaerales bacterium]